MDSYITVLHSVENSNVRVHLTLLTYSYAMTYLADHYKVTYVM